MKSAELSNMKMCILVIVFFCSPDVVYAKVVCFVFFCLIVYFVQVGFIPTTNSDCFPLRKRGSRTISLLIPNTGRIFTETC